MVIIEPVKNYNLELCEEEKGELKNIVGFLDELITKMKSYECDTLIAHGYFNDVDYEVFNYEKEQLETTLDLFKKLSLAEDMLITI